MNQLSSSHQSHTTIILTIITLLVAGLATPMQTYAGGTYLFSVTCQNREPLVAQWNTGDIDPGKEYLRVATGQQYPGCSIGDYNEAVDSGKPRDTYSHEGGVIAGVPVLGPIICGLFGC